jgi:hypothetical protein
MNKLLRTGRPPAALVLCLVGALTGGCATVAPGIPVQPTLTSGMAPLKFEVVGSAADVALLDEVERLLSAVGSVERRTVTSGTDINGLCSAGYDMVLRASTGRRNFSSNAAERNTLLIYEAAIIVGLPVTLISSVAWPWYGECTIEGDLETLLCGDKMPRHTLAFGSVRATGRGFISQGRLEEELRPHVSVALARSLVDAAARCGRFEKGGERCSRGTQ